YMERHTVSRLIGAPPGYVGFDQGGLLTDAVAKAPHSVLLLDEIEKAHRDVHQLLLQVFDEGRLTDGRGRTVDFRHAVIIMTSNLGAEQLEGKGKGKGKGRDKDDASARVLQAARAAFPVELWNRIEAPLVLKPLTRDELLRICQRLVRASSERLFAERGIRYRLDAAACAQLVDTCCDDASLGARPLRHVLTRRVESRIAEAILRGTIRAGSQLEVGLDGDEVTLSTVRAL
ncbi:MAG: ATP-dependent Clp protease ATP-binding subunit, partial [Myxococcales bacterium]|nr:ATP-dependent Clp protease ATP-binding subunit [Myxococcales bacterium]